MWLVVVVLCVVELIVIFISIMGVWVFRLFLLLFLVVMWFLLWLFSVVEGSWLMVLGMFSCRCVVCLR